MAVKALISLALGLCLPGFAGAVTVGAQPEALYALNTMQSPGMVGIEFGRYFDASARRAALMSSEAGSLPEKAAQALVPRPLPKPRRAHFAFILDIPSVPPPAFERTFRRLQSRSETSEYDELIREHAAALGLDPRLVKSLIAAESEFSAHAQSPAGALGLMQVMPVTAGAMGVPGTALFNPEANIRAGTSYLAHLFARAWKRYHLKGVEYSKAPGWLIQRIVAAYNAGPRFLAHRQLYPQTRDYIRKVLLFYRSPVADLRASPRIS
jgi:soluble lytic murein transglycosylase-like protein